jgi:ubiquitin-like 1-activating enzyme E1 B
MAFVTSAANIRMLTYRIKPLSYYTIKGMAGNIIPAIASTNSIVSGL